MAARSIAKPKSAGKSRSAIQELLKNPEVTFAIAVLFADAILVSLIIAYVPYTKIDWDAYMSQVSGFLEGERDYSNLKGDTGPLVYPAGFLYIYSGIQYVTGGQVFPAQICFGLLYIVNLGIVLSIYVKTKVVPWWALALLSLSKRVHSIFVLRLFNDCFAMTLLHAALLLLLNQKWHLGLILFSGAVSVKMNVLLYAPPLFILMLKAMNLFGVISALAGAALVQILLGLPFLLSHPVAYLSRAFNLGRVFIHFWSVNFKFIPESIFVSREFAVVLLAAHLSLLILFAHYRWCRQEGGLHYLILSKFNYFKPTAANFLSIKKLLTPEHIATTMFVGNFIGIVCARSLHYQFYSWYFYSLPYLLWKTTFPTFLRILLFVLVELCWNVYPSNVYSSIILFVVHLIILVGLWTAAAPENPYVDDDDDTKGRSSSKRKTK